MQLLPDSSLHVDIAELKKGISKQLKTVRGKILDRNGKVIAVDQPQFYLCIDYKLSCFLDERVRRAKLLKAERDDKPNPSLSLLQQQLQTKIEDDKDQGLDLQKLLPPPVVKIVSPSSGTRAGQPQIEIKLLAPKC